MSSDEGHGLARPIARHLHMQPNLGTTKEQTSPPRSRRDRPEPPATDQTVYRGAMANSPTAKSAALTHARTFRHP